MASSRRNNKDLCSCRYLAASVEGEVWKQHGTPFLLAGVDALRADILPRYCVNRFCFPDKSTFKPAVLLACSLNAEEKPGSADTKTLRCRAYFLIHGQTKFSRGETMY